MCRPPRNVSVIRKDKKTRLEPPTPFIALQQENDPRMKRSDDCNHRQGIELIDVRERCASSKITTFLYHAIFFDFFRFPLVENYFENGRKLERRVQFSAHFPPILSKYRNKILASPLTTTTTVYGTVQPKSPPTSLAKKGREKREKRRFIALIYHFLRPTPSSPFFHSPDYVRVTGAVLLPL